MKKAVIFDMDGLMIDSERMTWEGYKSECKKRGYEMDFVFYISLTGYPMTTVRRKLIGHFGKDFPVDEVTAAVHEYIENRFVAEGVPLKPGLTELLTFIRKRGYRTAVATSSDSDRVERILKYAKLTEYFDEMVCGDEVCFGKPNPDIFLKGLKKLGVSPKEAYVLEDSENGILASYRAGIDVICIPDMKEPGEEYRKMALCVVDSLLSVKNIMIQSEKEDAGMEKKQGHALTFHHVCVVASDYRKAVEFYVENLGFEIYRESYSCHRKAKKLELYSGGRYMLELFVKEDEKAGGESGCKDPDTAGLDHISFLTENIPGMLKYLEERDVKVSEVKADRSTGKKYGFCWDPDGVKIEFYER